jgi:hypothetical protein
MDPRVASDVRAGGSDEFADFRSQLEELLGGYKIQIEPKISGEGSRFFYPDLVVADDAGTIRAVFEFKSGGDRLQIGDLAQAARFRDAIAPAGSEHRPLAFVVTHRAGSSIMNDTAEKLNVEIVGPDAGIASLAQVAAERIKAGAPESAAPASNAVAELD